MVLGLLLTPSIVQANGWISAVNAFRQTPEFCLLFTAIVGVESCVLWRWLKPVSGWAILWRVAAVNAASSLAGDALFRLGWAPMQIELWKQAIPFFLLTVLIEGPAMRLLLRKHLPTWKRAALVIITANVASYALLLGIERPLVQARLKIQREQERKLLAQWTNAAMVVEAPGRLFATRPAPGQLGHRLRYFDFVDRQWHAVDNSPSIDPRYWHVEGDQLAFLTYGEPASREWVKVTTLPECTPVREFRLPETPYRYDSGWDVALSPDRTQLAVLVPQHEIREAISSSRYRVLGKTCLLAIFDLHTGHLALCPRKASHTLCWLPDSRTILFRSLPDEAWHEQTTLPKGWQARFDARAPGQPQWQPALFAFHLRTGLVEPFKDLPYPSLAADAGMLGFRSETGGVGLLDLEHHTVTTLPLGPLHPHGEIPLSPDGRFAVVPFALHPTSTFRGHPILVDLQDPSRRHALEPFIYRLIWARTTRW